MWEKNRQITFKGFGSFSLEKILSPWRVNHNLWLWQQRSIFLSIFYSLEIFFNLLVNPLKQLSFKLNKWWKPKRASHMFWEPSSFQGGICFKILYSRSQRTPVPSSVLTTEWNLMLTTQHNSISPRLNTAPPVTSTVNQGRTPLLWIRLERLGVPNSEFNSLWTGQNRSIVEFSDHHCICQILRPLQHNLTLMYPKGPKYAQLNKHNTPFHSSIQSARGSWEHYRFHISFGNEQQKTFLQFHLFVIWQMGWKRGWVTADWTAATLGSQELKNKHTLSESTGSILMLHRPYLFVSLYEGIVHRGKPVVTFPVISEDFRGCLSIPTCPSLCMKFHYHRFVPLYYFISMSGQLQGNANIPGPVDTELKNLAFGWMASSEAEVRQRKRTVLPGGEKRGAVPESWRGGWLGVEGGRKGTQR